MDDVFFGFHQQPVPDGRLKKAEEPDRQETNGGTAGFRAAPALQEQSQDGGSAHGQAEEPERVAGKSLPQAPERSEPTEDPGPSRSGSLPASGEAGAQFPFPLLD